MSREPAHEPAAAARSPTRRRFWRAKFADAFRGIKLGVRGHSSFSVHFFAAAVVIASAATLGLGLADWCILIGCITAVIVAELFNSAIEMISRLSNLEQHPQGKGPLDIAAGAVLVVSIGAATIGAIIFVARLVQLIR